ncbi:MAG: tetratricopeptide repeat protein [Deltaproteobacteria bacterium]|nr:tetratricopeptide repeat protein [Deltaproteobacteria bacterium]
MREFFKRQGIRLEVEDIARYARILIDDLSPVLGSEDFRLLLLDSPDQEAGLNEAQTRALAENNLYYDQATWELHLPVVYNDRPLAMLTAALPVVFDLPEAAHSLLLALVKQSLEKVLLYKINITDQETGLYNEDYFRAYLKRELQTFMGRGSGRGLPKPLSFGGEGDYPGLTVLLVEIAKFNDLASTYGRLEAGRAMRALAQSLRELASPSFCAVRLAPGRLGLVLPRQDIQAGLDLAEAMQDPPQSFEGQDLPRMTLNFGLAAYPLDFTDEYGQTEAAVGDEGELAEALSLKVELALSQALAGDETRVFTFGEILKKGGRIVQVLPLNRVVVNLGRVVGARVGQVFSLSGMGRGDEIDFKGEVVLAEVQENFAVGEVINLRDSLSRVKAGDTLALSQTAREEPPAGLQEDKERLDPLLGIPDHLGFIRLFDERMEEEEKFGIILVRVDGYDSYRQTMGRLLSDQQFKSLYDMLQEDMPQKALTGRFSADCLVVFSPGMDEAAAQTLAETWRSKVNGRHPQTVSLGLAVYPCASFTRPDTLVNAQKALEHASFFGPDSQAAFDAVSLNISADKLFEAGDLEEAVAEFEKALELDPDDLNVLNSLGVCYGYERHLDLALECFGKVMKLDPQNLMAHFNQGFAFAMADRPMEALENFRRAAEIDGQNFDVLFQLGKMALELERIDEAVASLERAEKAEDSRPIVFRYLGESLLRAGRDDEAINAYKAAVRCDPKDAASMSQLGVLFMDKGADLEVALSLTRQSVDLDKSNALFRERLARALLCVRDLAGAEDQYRQALNMGVHSREVYYHLGRVIQDQDRLEEAVEWLKRALEMDPEYGPALQAQETIRRLMSEQKNSSQEETRM